MKTRNLEALFSPLRWAMPMFEAADGAGSGGDAGAGDTGGDAGAGAEEGADDKVIDGGAADDGIVLDGGSAEGDDDPDGDKDGDDTAPKDGDDGNKDDDDDGDDGDDGDEETGAPEAYDFSELMPEGVELDEGMADAMIPAMKELDLSQKQADGLVKAFIEGQTKAAEKAAEDVSKMLTGWVKTAKADKEIGLSNWDDTVRDANSFIKKFGTPELVEQVMKGQGMGNHPEMIRIFARAGKATADDVSPSGGATDTSGETPTEAVWYPKTPNTKKG